jgi:hypothetical protein
MSSFAKKSFCGIALITVAIVFFDCSQPDSPVPNTWDIAITQAAHGTITANVARAVEGITVTLTVTPDDGYALKAGSLKVNDGAIELSGSGNVYTFSMPTGPVTVAAAFEAVLTVNIPAFDHGTITANPTSAAMGTTITLTVAAEVGYGLQADSLTVKDATNSAILVTGAGTTYTFIMPDTAATVAAVFVELGDANYSVSVDSAISHGTVAASLTSAAANAAITLTVTPDTGYRLQADSLKVNGGDVAVTTAGTGYTFTMPAANVTVTAVFELIPVTWSAQADGASGAVTSTKIDFTFNGAVDSLIADNITITDDSGSATKKDLTMDSEKKYSLTINVETAGDVKVTINKDGIDDTEQSVPVHKAPPLTPVVQFGTTENSADVEVGNLDGEDDDSVVNMNVKAEEKNWVYIMGWKETNQTITPAGEDAGKVTVYTEGTVDGETASEERAVIKVDARSLVFYGGKWHFALEVADKDGILAPRTINVTLEIKTRKTGAALFRVTRDGNGVITLERLDLGDASFETTEAALKWVDVYCETGVEYLIRVEQDETSLPRFLLSFNNRGDVTLRLQGDENGPHVLKQGNTDSVYYNKDSEAFDRMNNSNSNYYTGVFNIGPTRTKVANPGKTFILGSNVTLAGLGDQKYSAGVTRCLVRVWGGSTFVMEKGSCIADWYSASFQDATAIVVEGPAFGNPTNNQIYHGKLRIEGGSFTNCTLNEGNALMGEPPVQLIFVRAYVTDLEAGSFYKAESVNNSIVFSGNNNNSVSFFAAEEDDDIYIIYDLSEHTGEMSIPVAE